MIHVNKGFSGEGHPNEIPRCGDASKEALASCTEDEGAFKRHEAACPSCLAVLTDEHEAALAFIAQRQAATMTAKRERARALDVLASQIEAAVPDEALAVKR